MSSLPWNVVAVFDPDGTGQDFAYTVGVWPPLPELHVWARPTDGDDPGADWKFSPQDCTRVLNRVARRWLDGELVSGSSWTEEFDGGDALVTFVMAESVPSPGLDTFALASKTPVVSVRWSLSRLPAGVEDRPLAAELESWVAVELRRLVSAAPARCAFFAHEEPAVMVPLVVDVAPVQRFGPWSPVVELLRSLVRLEHPDAPLRWLPSALLVLPEPLEVTWGLLSSRARRSGRRRALNEVVVAAGEDAAFLASLIAAGDVVFQERLARSVHAQLCVVYGAWVLRDVVNEMVFDRACGWVDALVDPVSASARFHAVAARRFPQSVFDSFRDAVSGSFRLSDGANEWAQHAARCALSGVGAPLSAGAWEALLGVAGLGREAVEWLVASSCQMLSPFSGSL